MPATAIPSLAVAIASPVELGVDQPAHVAGQLLQLAGVGRVGAQVALGVAHGARLKRGVEADLAARADDQLGGAAADVDHQGAVGRCRALGEAPR